MLLLLLGTQTNFLLQYQVLGNQEMLRILIALLKLCIYLLKGIDKWFHEKGIDRATQTDISMIVPEGNIPEAVLEGNIPKAVPEENIPTAVPVPMANPAPTRVGAAKAKSTAKAKANAKADTANLPCWFPNCPKCESPMKLRTAHRGGMFYGCTTYPDCNGSRPPNYFDVKGAKGEK